MSLSLTYFDFDASRGLECRLALKAAGLDFEDVRLQRDQWAAMKPTTPFGGLPILRDGDWTLTQCNAILGYIGRTRGLHPTDPREAAQHEALLQSVEDLRNKIPGGQGLSDEAKKAAREEFAAGWLSQWASTVQGAIKGPFVAGDALNVVDIKLFVILRSFLSGTYDHIPASLFDAWPRLPALHAAVAAHPAVAAYFASR